MTAVTICKTPSAKPGMPLGWIDAEVIDDTERHRRASSVMDQAPSAVGRMGSVVLIDDRMLVRECLHRSLTSHHTPWALVASSSIEDWLEQADQHPPLAAVLLHVGSDKITDPHVEERIRNVFKASGSAPLIILAERDDVVQILTAFEHGVRGYVPSSVSVEVCVEAINLALAGGTFVPASAVLAMRDMIKSDRSSQRELTDIFSSRQTQVAKAIWEGKPNKIIAYQLNMCESTVKVHTRTIMRKLNATNRTEVAYKVSHLFAGNGVSV